MKALAIPMASMRGVVPASNEIVASAQNRTHGNPMMPT